MGFGLLFIGYVITFISSLNPFGVYIRAFGSILVLLATRKLRQYNSFFKYPLYISFVFIALNFAAVITSILDFMYEIMLMSSNLVPAVLDTSLMYLNAFVAIVLNLSLLVAIKAIAKDTGSDNIASSCITGIFFVSVYFVLDLLLYILPGSIGASYTKYMSMPIVLLNIVWLIMNAVLIFRCYVRICDENDVDMNAKESKFKLFHKTHKN